MQSPARPSTGPLRTAALRQAPRGPGPGGDTGEKVDPHLALEGGGAGREEGGLGGETGMGRGQTVWRTDRGGEEGGGPQGSEGVEPTGHGVDRSEEHTSELQSPA